MKKKILLLVAAVLCVALAVLGIILAQGEFEELSGWRQTAWAVLNRTRLEHTQFTGTPSTDSWSEADPYLPENMATVQKEPGKDLVILNLTDLHMADFDYYGSYNIRLFSHIREMVEENRPDLITISGDLFCTDSVALSVHQLTEFMDILGVPWAPILGNHDDGGNCDADYLAEVMMESELCLLQKGDPEMGVGNYVVNICEGEKIVHSLILMDTHGDGLWEKQLAWYRWAAEGANAPSTVIMHIPIVQYQLAYDAAWDGSGWKDGFEAFGAVREAICPEPTEDGEGVDTGFFAAVKEIGLTGDILCGHDHNNDFSILYEGVRLTYGMRLGVYGSHGPENQGATLLCIDGSGHTAVRHIYRFG